ncbi:hypothetical protein [Actinomadura rubrisoli]|uniref:VWA domain-containing protein n=1 Tax=Actinomadura rubrisoli TaxID=2530368 RepID=A0A4R5CEX9_9ACTN|nr:hypothetical protein [Actinomadura rubrisoli]TDD96843.1 hypothetical protein E1298_02360 [Actinomadura rubrisoli]
MPDGGPVPGEGERLLVAQRMFDAVAAARVSPSDGRDLPYIRGGRPSEAEWALALRRAEADSEPADRFRGRIQQVVTELSDRGRLAIIEAGEPGIAVTVVDVDEFGLPRRRPRPAVPWSALVPMLATGSPEELRFRLAGGLGGVDQDLLWAELRRNLAEHVPLPEDYRLELVCTAPGWPVPERALSHLADPVAGDPLSAAEGRPAPDPQKPRRPPSRLTGVDVTVAVADAVAALPLRATLELVVVEVEAGSGKVLPTGARLFAAGDGVGTERGLSLRCVHPHEDGTVLAVMTWRDDGPRVLSTGVVRLPAGRHRLRAVLAGAGQVKFVEPDGVAPERRSWSELMATLPEQLVPEVTELDVVCVIDLCAGGFESRRRLASEFVKLVKRRFTGPEQLRVAVVAYGRHDFRLEKEHAGVLRGAWLAPAATALDTLAGLRPVRPDRVPGAPLEDALHQVAQRVARIPARRRVVTLFFGDRPPHPPRDDPDGLLPCPWGHDWRRMLGRIERHPGLTSAAVLDSSEHLGPAWHRLGRTALLPLAQADAWQLAAATHVIVPESGRLVFPMLDPEN